MVLRELLQSCLIAGVGTVLLAPCAQADIASVNGYRLEARFFNDFPTSTLTINGVGYATPSAAAIAGSQSLLFEERFARGTPGNFANKHLAYFSTDQGATPYSHLAGQSFAVGFSTSIQAGPAGPVPRKEGMIQIENPRPGFTDEGRLLLGSEGEVAVYGASMPFFSCRVPSSAGIGAVGVTGADWYTPGTTAQVLFEYFAPGVMDPLLGAYRLSFTDAVQGFRSSGLKIWGVEGDGVAGFQSGAKFAFTAQNQRNPTIADASTISYGNITIVPAPSGVFVLAGGAAAVMRRRRASR